MNIDQSILNQENLKKLENLNNPKVLKIVEEFTNLLKPSKVSVITDSQEDIDFVVAEGVFDQMDHLRQQFVQVQDGGSLLGDPTDQFQLSDPLSLLLVQPCILNGNGDWA